MYQLLCVCVRVCVCTVASVVHTMSEGEPVGGVTSLGEEIYLLRLKASGRDQVEVYDVITAYSAV